MDFTEAQKERYRRHLIIPEIGDEGQKKIRRAKVFVVGAGGLGSPCAYYLCAAGVGRLGIADSDRVELSNLSRQILHSTPDVDQPKIESARRKLQALNPDVEIAGYKERVTPENILFLIREYDIVVDASDNFPTRYLVNDACVMAGKPMVHGGVSGFDGQVFTVLPRKGPCYRCLFPEPPPPDSGMPPGRETGVLGVVPGVIGILQASEVIKFVLEKGELLVGRLLVFNVLEPRFRIVNIPRDERCAVCGETPAVPDSLSLP